MKLQDLFPGSFNADHFIGGPQRLTVAGIVPILFKEEDGAETQQKGKMTFRECSSYWVFGKEAASELAEQIQSDDTDHWVGHVVELRRDHTNFKGKRVPCVRASFADVAKPVTVAVPIAITPPRAHEDLVADLEAQLAAARARTAVPA